MANITIDELLEGTQQRTSKSEGIFHQNDLSFKSTNRPNPTNQINSINQAILEAELGTNIEIGDNARRTISLDDKFTLTKPVKRGLNAGLELYASTNDGTLTFAGLAIALFQNIDPGDLVDSLNLHNLNVVGDGSNSVFDVIGSSIVEAKDAVFTSFDSIGIINNPVTLFDLVSFSDCDKGLILKNPFNISLTRASVVQFGPTGLTAFSVMTTVPVNIDYSIIRAISFFAGDSLFFIDPNSPAGSVYTIEKSGVVAGDFYQQGVDINISSITDNSGIAVFNTVSNHNLKVGDHIKLKDYVTQVQLNTKHIVTIIGTNTSFETGVPFVADDNTGVLPNRPVNIISVANNGAGKTRFTTDVPHGLRVKKLTVIRDFVTETTYNQTAEITAVDTPLTGTTFDADIDFNNTDTGIMDSASLDETSPLVTANNNVNSPDSMSQAEARVKDTGITVTGGAFIGDKVPVEDLSPTIGDWIEDPNTEEFIINTSTGLHTYIGIQDKSFQIKYSLEADPASGPSQILAFALNINGIEQIKTIINIDTAQTNKAIYDGGIFTLSTGDSYQLFKSNLTNTNDTITGPCKILTTKS